MNHPTLERARSVLPADLAPGFPADWDQLEGAASPPRPVLASGPESFANKLPESADGDSADGVHGSLQRVEHLARSMASHLQSAMHELKDIHLQTQILAFNGQLEAARAGAQGRGFGVVAGEMVRLSANTTATASKMERETKRVVAEMTRIIQDVGANIRGTRLSDLALTNIELIDRNLYERSCDVRWWASDSSVVEVLEKPDPQRKEHACHRLGVILDSYTVYYDLVVCDLKGNVVANGRPGKFDSIGSNHREAAWFREALRTRDGTEFGFQSVHRTRSLANGQYVLVYSSAIRAGGRVNGKPVGVLGIVFNWESLAQTIVKNTQISAAEKACTRVCIVDDKGLVMADTSDRLVAERLSLPDQDDFFRSKKEFRILAIGGVPHLAAHALSPGFETYKTGWHSLILQPMALDGADGR